MKALSIRQPWAWLIVNGHKDIENRSWRTKYRGPVLIHAAQGMTRSEYNNAVRYAAEIERGLPYLIPSFERIERGGIVGVASVAHCVDWHASPWYMGEKGFVLANAEPLPFYPMKWKLSFFETSLTPEDLKGSAA